MASNKKQEAKDYIENRISALFGSEYVGTEGGKIYLWGKAKDGEKIQIAVSLTCPNNTIAPVVEDSGGFNWGGTSVNLQSEPEPAKEQSEEEKESIAKLLASLGL